MERRRKKKENTPDNYFGEERKRREEVDGKRSEDTRRVLELEEVGGSGDMS